MTFLSFLTGGDKPKAAPARAKSTGKVATTVAVKPAPGGQGARATTSVKPAPPPTVLNRFAKDDKPFVFNTESEIIAERIYFTTFAEAGEQISKNRVVSVASWLSTRVVPVLVSGRKDTLWFLVSPDYANSDDLLEVAKEARLKGYEMHPDYQVVVMSTTLLLAISRGNLGSSRINMRRKIDSNRESASLFEGFIDIVDWAYSQGAADVDFRYNRREDRSQVGFSIGGKWVYPEKYNIPSQTMIQMLGLAFQYGEGASEASLDSLKEQQMRIYFPLPKAGISIMLRWASMAGDEIFSVTTRLIELNRKIDEVSLAALGYLPSQEAILQRVLNSDGGAVILSGVVNSGKSTTIATLMGMVPKTRKIVTIEDPVEFMIPGAISNTVARPLTGEASPMLAAKLRTLKRTGFNDLLLGEIRDRETGAAAQDVFESGQKLYSTVHTGRAWMIPDRLAGQSIGIPREVLATPGNMRLLVNQSLLPKNCDHCKLPFTSLMQGSDRPTHWRNYGARLERLYDVDLSMVRVRNPEGCSRCRRIDMPQLNGFNGRTSASEMIEPDETFCRLVSKGDNVGILHYLADLRGNTRYDDPEMLGKSSMDCAVYKMSQGDIDPREVEPRYTDFETVELNRGSFRKSREERAAPVAPTASSVRSAVVAPHTANALRVA